MAAIGIGIIGTGGIAASHAPAVQALNDATLVAILSRQEASGLEFLQQHGALDATVHTSLASFVADPRIDLVIDCSPDRLHFQNVAACLENSKHVLAEKPLAVTADEASRLVQLAEDNQRTLAISFRLRFHDGHRKLQEQVVDRRAVGNVRHIRVMWAYEQHDDSNWRAKTELGKWWSLAAVGSHCIDLVRWFAQDPDTDWKQFGSITSNEVWRGPHDETAVIAGQLSNGITAEIVSSVNIGCQERIEIFGDKGHAACENTMGRDGTGVINLNGNAFPFEPKNPFVTQLQDVIDSIRTGRAPYADAIAGRRSVQDLLLASDV